GQVRRGTRTFQVLGVDPLAEGPFRAFTGGAGGFDLGAFMARPDGALLAGATAGTLGLAPGDTFAVTVAGQERVLRLAGLLRPEDENSRRALESLVVVDVATAQGLFGMAGRLSRIDLVVPEGAAGEALLGRVARVLPEGAEVVPAAARTET